MAWGGRLIRGTTSRKHSTSRQRLVHLSSHHLRCHLPCVYVHARHPCWLENPSCTMRRGRQRFHSTDLQKELACHPCLRHGSFMSMFGPIPKLTRHYLASVSSSRPSPPPPLTPRSSRFVESMPKAVQPYMRLARLDKPIGTYLLLWPGFWSLALAAAPGALPDWKLLAAFGVGTLVMRSAGCTVNDLWDRDLDKNVARTKHRPITSGEISVQNGVGFLGIQLLAGLGVLTQLNEYTIYLGMASVPLVLAYPLMKRWTDYPQLFLGITFNWGALMGWAATHGSCDWPIVLPLYASAVAWTVVYDTLYAHQDKRDDSRLGIRSTALTFGDSGTKPVLTGLSAAMVGGLLLVGIEADLSWHFYLGTGLTASHLAWQLITADLNCSSNLSARFESNKWVGGLVFGSIVAGRYFT